MRYSKINYCTLAVSFAWRVSKNLQCNAIWKVWEQKPQPPAIIAVLEANPAAAQPSKAKRFGGGVWLSSASFHFFLTILSRGGVLEDVLGLEDVLENTF